MAKLYFNYSTMNAGKSTLLLQASHNYRERGMTTIMLTASYYEVDGKTFITSRIGIEDEATKFDVKTDLMAMLRKEVRQRPVNCVLVDEAQFLTPEQVWQLARAADELGVPVMCYGLRTDFQGNLFPGSEQLLAIADSLREVRTICHCGRKATMVARFDADGNHMTDGEQVAVEKTIYHSYCRRHWAEIMGKY
jgi:thymidine kinase